MLETKQFKVRKTGAYRLNLMLLEVPLIVYPNFTMIIISYIQKFNEK